MRLPSHHIDRRELLTLLLGATLGLKACRRPRPRPIDGRVVGGNKDFGHQLRRLGDIPDRAPSRHVPTVIVGAGIAGLSAAWRLERQGEPNFVVLELEDRAGGTACYGTDGIVPYPWGAHYLPVPSRRHESLCQLLAEMGVVERGPDDSVVGKEQFLVREPAERLFVGNRWVEGLTPAPILTAEDRRQFAAFQAIVQYWIGWRDVTGRRAFTLPLADCSADVEATDLDRVSASTWLSSLQLTSNPLRWWLEYACRDDYGCTLETTSAWALLFYHAARVNQPGMTSSPFLTWPEGNGRIVRHLENAIGHRLVRNQLVVDISPGNLGASVSVLDLATRKVEVISADHVVLAAPSFLARYLVRPFRENPPAHYAAFTYSPWLVANLHLRSRPRNGGYPLAWDNVVYGGASLGYVVATHQTLDDDGPSIWTYYQPMLDMDPAAARRRLGAADHAATWDAMLTELAGPHPDLSAHATRLDVWQFGHAMIRPVPGMISGEARRRAALPFRAVHFAHTDLSGVALLDEAHYHGVRAADEVIAERRRQ